MKKITLNPNEQIRYKIKYSKKIILFDLIIILLLGLWNIQLVNSSGSYNAALSIFVVVFLIVPMSFITLKNGYRILFKRGYITTTRVILARGLLWKQFKTIDLKHITAVYSKRNLVDYRLKSASIKFIDTDNRSYILKTIKDEENVKVLLSEYLLQKHMSQSK